MRPRSLLLRDVVFGSDFVNHRRYPTTLSPKPPPPPPPTPHGRRRYCCCCCCCAAAVVLRLRLVSPAFVSKEKKNWLFCCGDRGDRARLSCGCGCGAATALLLLLLCCCLSDGVVLGLPLSVSIGATAPCLNSKFKMLPPRSPPVIWRPCTPFLRFVYRKHNQKNAGVNLAFF